MAFCPYFSLAYYLVLDDDPSSKYLFRSCANTVITDENGEIESKASMKWKNDFNSIVTQNFNAYKSEFGEDNQVLKSAKATKLNDKLGSHCSRKYTMQNLSETFDVCPHMVIFRVGIKMKSVNSFFDYVFGSERQGEYACHLFNIICFGF
jgi:hypothetical protein